MRRSGLGLLFGASAAAAVLLPSGMSNADVPDTPCMVSSGPATCVGPFSDWPSCDGMRQGEAVFRDSVSPVCWKADYAGLGFYYSY